jgi:hypothetical protein
VGTPLGLQFSIAVCVGLVAATFSPSIRRAIPRWFEVAAWVALIFVCWLGIAGVKDPHARELTVTLNWAVGQIFNTLFGLAGASFLSTMSANRFVIADAVVTLFGADLLALAMLSTHRQGRAWQPQLRLRHWMVVPATAPAAMAAPVVQPYAVDELSEKWASATAVAGAAAATWSVEFLIWARDVGLPRAEERLALAVAAVGRVETRVWLESVRETARELESVARDRFAGTGPEINQLALRVAATLNGVTESQQRFSPGGAPAHVVDMQALRVAQSLSRSGRDMSQEMKDENGVKHPDELAS